MEQLLSYAHYKTQNLCSTADMWLLVCSREFAAFNFDEHPFAKGKMISILFFRQCITSNMVDARL